MNTYSPDHVDELIASGDAFLQAGDSNGALKAYQAALAAAPDNKRASVWARLQMARFQPPAHMPQFRIQRAIEQEFPGEDTFVSSHMAVWGKTNSFMSDNRLLHFMWKHQALLPLPNWEWNIQTLLWAVKQTSGVTGDYMELGVFKGHTSIILAEYLDFSASARHWWLYDTFNGIPPDQADNGWAYRNARAYHGTYSFEEVSERFSAFPNIYVIKGRVPEILASRCPDRISLLHMDLNNAAAEVGALDFLFDRIQPGGIIVFDDYCWRASRAQHTAEKEWFSRRGLAVLELPTGQGVFVKT